MDKKQKKKWIPAVCFVVICGVVCVWVRYDGQKKEQIVFEKQEAGTLIQESDTKPQVSAEPGQENAGGAERTSEIYVHICGAVVTEGVYVLQNGCRLADGIAAAGGFRTDADTTYHNLALGLTDGQKVYVPTREETEALSVSERLTGGDAEGEGAKNSIDEVQGGKVNLNTAGAEELMTLDGIGEAKAERILQYREKVGPFQSVEELKKVSGIGDAIFERIKEDIVAE